MLATAKERAYLVLACCGMIAFAAILMMSARHLPFGSWLWPSMLLVVLVVARSMKVFLLSWLFKCRLNSPKPIKLPSVPKQEGTVYLGHAFEWTREHLELYYELEKLGIQSAAHSLLGDWKIQAVGPKPKELRIPVGVLNQHELIESTTGGGKSRKLELDVIQAIERGDALVVIDPKGDDRLLARVEEECKKHNRKFNFFGLPYPSHSVRYNPVENFVQPHEIADRVSLLLPAEEASRTFTDYAWDVINTVVNAMLLAKDLPITLNKIRRYAFTDTWLLLERVLSRCHREVYEQHKRRLDFWRSRSEVQNLEGWYQERKRDPNGIPQSDALDDLIKLIVHPRDHYQKMVVSLLPKLRQLCTKPLRRLLSDEGITPETPAEEQNNRISWDRVDAEGQVVYFYLGSLLGYTTANAVASMTLLDLTSYVGKRYAYQTADKRRRFTIVVDELADVIQPAFINLLNKSRGANVSIVMAVQSLNDLHAKLGSSAQAKRVLANVNTFVQMLVRDQTDAETFAAMAGKVNIRRLEESYRYEPALGDAGMKDVAGHRASFGQSWRTVESDLVPSSLLQRLCIGHFFAMYNGMIFKGIVPLLPDPQPSTIEKLKATGIKPEAEMTTEDEPEEVFA